jgi:hypothetical protein
MVARRVCRVLAIARAAYPGGMTTVHIEHPISDFTTWKAAFDRAAPIRAEHCVRAFEIFRPIDDPAYVVVRLDLDSVADAEAFVARLRQLWGNREATPALRGTPQVRILERAERG